MIVFHFCEISYEFTEYYGISYKCIKRHNKGLSSLDTRLHFVLHLIAVFKLLLLLDLLNPTLKILTSGKLGTVHKRNKQGSLGEEISHLLEGAVSGLGENGPEVDGVGEVADLNSLVLAQ